MYNKYMLSLSGMKITSQGSPGAERLRRVIGEKHLQLFYLHSHIVASELKDPICHSNECQIGSFSPEATI